MGSGASRGRAPDSVRVEPEPEPELQPPEPESQPSAPEPERERPKPHGRRGLRPPDRPPPTRITFEAEDRPDSRASGSASVRGRVPWESAEQAHTAPRAAKRSAPARLSEVVRESRLLEAARRGDHRATSAVELS